MAEPQIGSPWDTWFILFFAFMLWVYWKYRQMLARMQDDTQPVVAHQNPNYPVKNVENPFFIETDLKKSSLDDGVYFKLTVNNLKTPIKCLLAWSVKIKEFYQELDKPIAENLYKTDFLKDISTNLTHTELTKHEDPEHTFFFATPDECKASQEQQYDQITQTYPLIIILYRPKEDLEGLNDTEFIATIWIVHLKDKKTPTKNLFLYSKCLNNRTVAFNQLYAHDEDNCVVCRTEPSNHVLLPCKHLCVCSECAVRINMTCPMCRTPVSRTFKI